MNPDGMEMTDAERARYERHCRKLDYRVRHRSFSNPSPRYQRGLRIHSWYGGLYAALKGGTSYLAVWWERGEGVRW